MTFVKDGVRVVEHDLKASPGGFVAVVDDQALRKDVSQSDIVKDQAHERLMPKLRRAGRASLIAICQAVRSGVEAAAVAGKPLGPSDRVGDIPLDWAWALLKEACRTFQVGSFATKDDKRLAYHLAQTPLWETIADTGTTLQRLLGQAKREGHVAWTSKSYAEHADDAELNAAAISGDMDVLALISKSDDRETLRRLFGKRLVNVTRRLNKRILAVENRRRWRRRPMTPELQWSPDSAAQVVAQRVVAPEAVGEIGLRQFLSKPTLYLVKDGCLLCHRTAEEFLPYFNGILEATFTPNKTFDGVFFDDHYADALKAMVGALEPLHEQLATTAHGAPLSPSTQRTHLRHYLRLVLDPDFATTFGSCWGLSAKRSRKVFTGEAHVPALGVGLVPGREDGSPHPIARVPLFGTMKGRNLSLAQIEDVIEKHDRVHYVSDAIPENPDIAELVLRLSRVERELLTWIFGEYRLRDVKGRLEHRRLAERHRQKPIEPVRLVSDGPIRPACKALFSTDSLEGEIGLSYPPIVGKTEPWDVRLMVLKRTVATREIDLWLPPGIAVVNSDAFVPCTNFDDVRDDTEMTRARIAIRRAAMNLVAYVAGRFGSVRPPIGSSVVALLANALDAMVPTETFGQAYRLLAEQGDSPDGADTAYEALTDTLSWVELAVVDTGLERLLADDRPLSAVELRRQLIPDSPMVSEAVEPKMSYVPAESLFMESAALPEPPPRAAFAALRTVPLFEDTSGAQHGLDAVLAEARERPVGFVDSERDCVPMDTRLVLYLQDWQRPFLQRLLGAELLEHAGADVEAARSYQRFSRREEVESLTLASGAILVRTDLQDEGITGEVGLATGGKHSSWLHLYKHRRPIESVSGFCRFGLVAIANYDELNTDPRYSAVERDVAYGRVLAACEARMPVLMAALSQQWVALPDQHRDVAYRHVLDYLTTEHPGPFDRALLTSDPLLGRLAALEGVSGLNDARYSLLQLADVYREHDELVYLPAPEPGVDLHPDKRLLIVSGRLLTELKLLFPNVRHYGRRWKDDQLTVALRDRGAAELVDPSTVAVIERIKVVASPFHGQLMLPDSDGPELWVSLGAHGYEVVRQQVSEVFPCAGVVTVSATKYRELDGRLVLNAAQQEALKEGAFRLYRKLARRFGRFQTALPTGVRARRYLRQALLALHRQGGWGAPEPRKLRKLYNQLRDLPLFELLDGTWINLVVAVRDRPEELAPYGMWETVLPTAAVTQEPAEEEATAGGEEGQVRRVTAEWTAVDAAPGETPPSESVLLFDEPDDAEPQRVPSSADPELEAPHPDASPTAPEADIPSPPEFDLPSEAQQIDMSEVDAALATPAEPELPPPDPEEALVKAICAALEEICSARSDVLSYVDLSHIRFSDSEGDIAVTADRVGINLRRQHPAVARALETAPPDPMLVAFLAAALYTAVNIHLVEVTDADEDVFALLITNHLLDLRTDESI